MDDEHLLKLRYVGARFNGARLPVDVLSDLPAFRDLIVAFAKAQWLADNPTRRRLPKGFSQNMRFDLVRIEDGSAMPCLKWEVEEYQTSFPGISRTLRDRVGESVTAIADLWNRADHGTYPKSMSPGQIAAMERLGDSLIDGERIELADRKSADGNVIYLDAAKRREIITRIKPTYTRLIEGIGRLVANLENGLIRLSTTLYGEIQIDVGELAVKSIYDGNLGKEVQYSVLVELDHQDRYRGVIEARRLEIVDEEFLLEIEECRNRVEELRELGAGWNSGAGSPVTTNAVFSALKLIELKPEHCRDFRIFPTDGGGILFEFETQGWDLSVEFYPDGSGDLYGIEMSGPREIEPINFTAVDNAFLAKLNEYVGGDGK